MTKKTVGLVIPIGEFRPSLEETLISIARQDIDVRLAVFDASGDARTQNILTDYKALIDYHHEGKDSGQSWAIKKGWEELDTDIVGWLNNDDSLAPNVLGQVLEFFEDSTVVAVYGPSVVRDEAGRFRGMHPAVRPEDLGTILEECVISQPSCLVDYQAVRSVGGVNVEANYTMDWELWTRLYSKFPHGFKFCKSFLTVVEFGNTTKSSEISVQRSVEFFKLIRRHRSFAHALKLTAKFNYWNFRHYILNKFGDSDSFFIPPDKTFFFWDLQGHLVKGLSFGVKAPERELVFDLNVNGVPIKSKDMSVSHDEAGAHYIFSAPISTHHICKLVFDDMKQAQTLTSIAFLR